MESDTHKDISSDSRSNDLDPSAPVQTKRSVGQKLRAQFKRPMFWWTLLGCLVALGLISWFVQPIRVMLVNVLGQRNTLSIATITPAEGKAKASQLGNATVMVNGKPYKTDAQGKLTVSSVPYGEVNISVQKAGYQRVDYGVMLDFDPFWHRFGGKSEDAAIRQMEFSLKSTGIPVSFTVVDWLSGKPVSQGEFKVGDVLARADDQGRVSLRVPGTDASKVTVQTNFGGGYIDQTFELTLGSSDATQIKVVPGGRHYFLSKRSGVLSVYSCRLDGSDVQPLVVGTGQETDATLFALSPDGKYGVLSSSRDGARNARRDLLQRIYVVDLATKQLSRVDEAVNVAFADWSGSTLMYTTNGFDASTNSYPTTLRSVDAAMRRVYNFESADDIRVATVGFDKVLYLKYAKSGPDALSSPILRQAVVNATHLTTLGEQIELNNYQQLDYDRVAFKTAADQVWHEYNLNTDQFKTIAQPSSGTNTLQYLSTANHDLSKRLFIDRLDGHYTLVLKDDDTGAIRPLSNADGLSGPIRWVGDVVIYRVVTEQETADYAVSINGGDAHKIIAVTSSTHSLSVSPDQRFSYY